MREIKFRVWDKKNKRMMNWIDSIIWNSMGIESVKQTTPLQGHARKIEDVELMQYTGLKDKNEKEIWEGDILKWKHGDLLEVRWGEGEFIIWSKLFSSFGRPNGGTTGMINAGGYFMTSEVIGNIYENPLLIKKGK